MNLRRFSQGLFALLFIVIFLGNRYPYQSGPSADLFVRATPLLPLSELLSHGRVLIAYWPAYLIIFLTLIFGRFFCSWVCPLGTTFDLIRRGMGWGQHLSSDLARRLKVLPIGFLLFLVILIPFGINAWSWFDPLATGERLLTAFGYPLCNWGIPAILTAGKEIPAVGVLFSELKHLWGRWVAPEGANLYLNLFPIGIFAGILLFLEWISPRFWCRFLCPAGTWMGLLARMAFWRREVRETCISCGSCQRICPSQAIPAQDFHATDPSLCLRCHSCGDACPMEESAISWTFRNQGTNTALVSTTDFERRHFFGATIASIVTVGLRRIGLDDRTQGARFLRPPGSVPEPEFLDRCIRCLACVRMCRSNGKCLQPGRIQQDLLDLWTPQAVMRSGYCEYNCNLCGQVCPTGAILPLPLPLKKKASMGMAYFDKNLCIPHQRGEECLVCEEHCPVGDKAIKFDQREVVQPDGKRCQVKLPYIVRSLCIGCGICEQKCPLPGAPGVFVTPETAYRKSSAKELEIQNK